MMMSGSYRKLLVSGSIPMGKEVSYEEVLEMKLLVIALIFSYSNPVCG
jgi:hypothetical protein